MSDTSDPNRIERELDRTRSRLGSHLSELQDRLSPGQVLDDAMKYFRGSEGAAFGQNLLDSVRANPIPAALTGIGLAWLMASGSRPGGGGMSSSSMGSVGTGGASLSYMPSGTSMDTAAGTGRVRVYGGSPGPGQSDYAARVRTAEQGVVRQTGETESAFSQRLDEARGQALGLARQAQETAESFGQRIRDALASAGQAVTEGAQSLGEQASSAASSLGAAAQGAAQSVAQRASGALQQGGQSGGNLVNALTESPVLLGAIGLAAGALLGALLPQSAQEESALGGIAGQARDTARDLAQEAVDRGGRVLKTVVDTGRESVQSQGLTDGKTVGGLVDAALSGELAGGAKQVVSDVLKAGDQAVRKEALGQQGGDKPQT